MMGKYGILLELESFCGALGNWGLHSTLASPFSPSFHLFLHAREGWRLFFLPIRVLRVSWCPQEISQPLLFRWFSALPWHTCWKLKLKWDLYLEWFCWGRKMCSIISCQSFPKLPKASKLWCSTVPVPVPAGISPVLSRHCNQCLPEFPKVSSTALNPHCGCTSLFISFVLFCWA